MMDVRLIPQHPSSISRKHRRLGKSPAQNGFTTALIKYCYISYTYDILKLRMTMNREYCVFEKLDDHGRLLKRQWTQLNSMAPHRLDGPAVEEFDPITGSIIRLVWCNTKHGGLHREAHKPATLYIDPESNVIFREEYFMWNIPHRDDGGATKIYRDRKNGRTLLEEYHKDGVLHRDYDLPATIEFCEKTGNIIELGYYQRDCLHRESGPALIKFDKNGSTVEKRYFQKGLELPHAQKPPVLNR